MWDLHGSLYFLNRLSTERQCSRSRECLWGLGRGLYVSDQWELVLRQNSHVYNTMKVLILRKPSLSSALSEWLGFGVLSPRLYCQCTRPVGLPRLSVLSESQALVFASPQGRAMTPLGAI